MGEKLNFKNYPRSLSEFLGQSFLSIIPRRRRIKIKASLLGDPRGGDWNAVSRGRRRGKWTDEIAVELRWMGVRGRCRLLKQLKETCALGQLHTQDNSKKRRKGEERRGKALGEGSGTNVTEMRERGRSKGKKREKKSIDCRKR